MQIQRDSSVPVAMKLQQVTKHFFLYLSPQNLFTTFDNFFFLPHPGSVGTFPLSLNYIYNGVSKNAQCLGYLCVSFSLLVEGSDLFS